MTAVLDNVALGAPRRASEPIWFGFRRRPSVLPGFGIALGLTLMWLALIVLIPLSGLFLKTATLSFNEFWTVVSSRRAVNALKLSFGLSLAAAAINLVFGAIVA